MNYDDLSENDRKLNASALDLMQAACFGVAGNFTGHLEQAGEAADFVSVETETKEAPKAIFPTYIPKGNADHEENCPEFLHTFPFDSEKIIYPEGQDRLQIEPECAIVFNADWKDRKITKLTPICFGASNDCSIRREGAKKISLKKNWGPFSKGFSAHPIAIDYFGPGSRIDSYRIASFLVREGAVHDYGEDSRICDYSYIYDRLMAWMMGKLNEQEDAGPAEDINSYLNEAGQPTCLLISIGATRYTEYGEKNFLKPGDRSVVVLYPSNAYTHEQIRERVASGKTDEPDISVLDQMVLSTC